MKRLYILLFILLFTASCNNKESSKKILSIEEQVLKNEEIRNLLNPFLDIIDRNHKKNNHSNRMISISFILEKDSANCILCISTDAYYNSKYINGYIFINNALIVFYDLDLPCSNSLINRNLTTEFKDSIPGYKDISQIDMQYEMYSKYYRLDKKNKKIKFKEISETEVKELMLPFENNSIVDTTSE